MSSPESRPEQPQRNPYEQAVADFQSLSEQQFHAGNYLLGINRVMATGFVTSQNQESLFEQLATMAGNAASLAQNSETPDAASEFQTMRDGYQAALDRARTPQQPVPAAAKEKAPRSTRPRRSMSGVASG